MFITLTTLPPPSHFVQRGLEMKKMTIADVRCRLPVGAKFTAEFIRPLVVRPNVGEASPLPTAAPTTSARVVRSQTAHEMATEYLDGPRAGRVIYCNWKGVTARVEENAIILSGPDDFLKITGISN